LAELMIIYKNAIIKLGVFSWKASECNVMGDYGSGTAIFLSIIAGFVMLFFIDGLFVYTFTGFLATYLTRPDRRSAGEGGTASLILAVLSFASGMIFGPEMPGRIAGLVGPDVFSLSVGFLIVCAISLLLGSIGGYIAVKAFRNDVDRL